MQVLFFFVRKARQHFPYIGQSDSDYRKSFFLLFNFSFVDIEESLMQALDEEEKEMESSRRLISFSVSVTRPQMWKGQASTFIRGSMVGGRLPIKVPLFFLHFRLSLFKKFYVMRNGVGARLSFSTRFQVSV